VQSAVNEVQVEWTVKTTALRAQVDKEVSAIENELRAKLVMVCDNEPLPFRLRLRLRLLLLHHHWPNS
jgi:hypothetical protein